MLGNPFFVISLLSSTLLAFFTVAFGVEILLFKVKSPRFRSLLRMLPFCAVLIDFFLKRFCISNWLNPLNCTSCLKKFILEIFFPLLKPFLTAKGHLLAELLSSDLIRTLSSAVTIAFISTTALFALYKSIYFIFCVRRFRALTQEALPCTRPITNKKLLAALQKHAVKTCICPEIYIPMATAAKQILIPAAIVQTLSQDELEAIVAHELEHLKWRDPIVGCALRWIASFFWWIPTHAWIKKLEQEREAASDLSIESYGIAADHLASALVKVSRFSKRLSTNGCETPSSSMLRLQEMLGFIPKKRESLIGINLLGVALGAFILFTCLWWL